jgi:3-deoxy-D-manno-octulosonic-acid transferase
MSVIYQIFINLLVFGMKVLSLFNDKTKKGVEGRKESLQKVKAAFSKTDPVIWMHAASLGEYEQGLPVLEQLKAKWPDHKILITFFSPSGYENVIKRKHIADVICYLPFDKKSHVKEFVSQFSVKLFFTVKYEYWYHLLQELKNQGAKIYVISALFYDGQSFFTSYGKWFVQQLHKNIDWFFHQTDMSFALAKNIGLTKSSVTGDTRFDRVKQLRETNNHVHFIKDFIGQDKAVVFGSSWEAEEKIAEDLLLGNPYAKIIMAPHDLKRVQYLKQLFPNSVLYSDISKSDANLRSRVLIIDSIGLLSKLYSYADIAVVGGGFHDAGLHNILEAATFGVPVIFGNHYRKNPEADELIAVDGGKSFENAGLAADFVMFLINNEEMLQVMSANAEKFVSEKPNSTELIIRKMLA